MDIDIASLEQATLDAVAPQEVGHLPGWLLPFDTTTVGRAISAVPIAHDAIDPEAISAIEARYAQRRLPTQFRVADVAGLATLHEKLRRLGYQAQRPTLTLVGTIHTWPAVSQKLEVQVSAEPTQAWKSVYLAAEFDPVDGANRVRALSRSKCLLYASLCKEAEVVAAGTAAFSQGWASLHGMRTLAHQRGKGYATALIAVLGREARARGLDRCFLQVEEENTTAIRLYHGLGFQTAWRYHYWCKRN